MKGHVINKEIIRYNCYCDLYSIIVDAINTRFYIYDNKIFKEYNGWIPKIRAMIVRWIYILILSRKEDDDPVFIARRSTDLKNQIKIDNRTYFSKYATEHALLKFDELLTEIIYQKFTDYTKILRDVTLKNDKKVIVTKDNTLIYQNSPYALIKKDPYVSTTEDTITMKYYSNEMYLDSSKYDINTVFAIYFRYKYMYADNQTLAYSYTSKINSAIECFSTPFNRHHFYYCSAFPDLEMSLGSLGEFFQLMNNVIKNRVELPVKDLKINPIFDEVVDLKVSEITLKLLSTAKDKYTISLILPNWKDFKAVDILVDSKYFVQAVTYKKGTLEFKNYFTGKEICPCDIIIIYLKN